MSNLPYEGGSFELASQLGAEWRAGCELLRTGAAFDAYQSATQTLRANAYITNLRGAWLTRAQYEAQQESCTASVCERLDADMCSYVFIGDFDEMLSSLDVDVLAIYGEKDLNINWQKTRAAYQVAIGQNPDASLTMRSFAHADHNLHVAATGSIKEMQSMTAPVKADGYYRAQIDWLRQTVLESDLTG